MRNTVGRGGGNFRSSGIIGSVMELAHTSMLTVMESSSAGSGSADVVSEGCAGFV